MNIPFLKAFNMGTYVDEKELNSGWLNDDGTRNIYINANKILYIFFPQKNSKTGEKNWKLTQNGLKSENIYSIEIIYMFLTGFNVSHSKL